MRSRDCSRDLAVWLNRENSPSSCFSAVKTTRKGAPFHGTIGEASMISPTSSWQLAIGAWASDLTLAPLAARAAKGRATNPPAISNDAVARCSSLARRQH